MRGIAVAQLEESIRDEIRRMGPITFARFMELALYHPEGGYYSGGGVGREPVGWAGDFFTSGDVSPLWGWAIARQLRQMWRMLGEPARFDVIEPGELIRPRLILALGRFACQTLLDTDASI